MKIENLLRENIKKLQPYSCARNEYTGAEAVFLDANENPYANGCNRYPDPFQKSLKKAIAEMKGVSPDRVILGNGSDEIIDLLIRAFCSPAKDNLIVFSPGYSMYEVSAAINDVTVKKIDLDKDFQPDTDRLAKEVDQNTKIIFLCSPNNPVGNVIPLQVVEKICADYNCLVVLDEAYIDFADIPSGTELQDKFNNLVILQTMSKAWGMAGLRLGVGIASEELIAILNKVKPPYNISSVTQERALQILSHQEEYKLMLQNIKAARRELYEAFQTLGIFDRIFPSEANFILVTLDNNKELYDFLVENGVVTRLRHIPPELNHGLRISVGTEEENRLLLELLGRWKEINKTL